MSTQTGTNHSCLVTGGAGFIGSNLCHELLLKSYSVICVDNLISGSEKNIERLKSHPDFTFIRWDVIKELPILPKVDYVFHLASPASVPDYQNNPEETARVNSEGTRNLLKFAKVYKAKFLFTSTSEIYGDPLEHPQKESYWGNVNPIGDRACYDEAKRYGEMMTMLYHNKHGVDTRIIRIFNTYGPYMRKDDGRVISNIINQALSGAPITVYGDGSQTRSFCFVSDMVNGLMGMMFSPDTNGQVVNIGNPQEISMLEIAKKIKAMTKSKSEILFKSLPADDPIRRKPDITSVRKLTGWNPEITLEEGLEKTIEYYRSI